MHKRPNMTLHYIIRAVILIGFSFYVVYLANIDRLQYYIVPRMIPYVKYAAVGLFVLAWYYAYLAVRNANEKVPEEACGCGHEPPQSRLKNGLLYGLFVVPLIIGFALPDKIMGSDAAALKGMNLNAAEAQQQTVASALKTLPPSPSPSSASASPSASVSDSAAPSASEPAPPSPSGEEVPSTPTVPDEDPLDLLFPADSYTLEFAELGKRMYKRETIRIQEEGFLEMLTLLDLYKHNFLGKTVVMSGFVYREDDMNADQFVVSRMAMQCCSADAMPYGFLVKWDKGAELAKDAWITVTGVIGLTEYNGNEIIELDARKIEGMDAPDDPYVYPFFDDFEKLGG
ncbi:TIGR03943 family putative permease subunit [Paenibacillaceae bacterium WGS1546]|uniref:TIGR03943 family putative permease subunit n=1 Tax=Cohnella sp. WGS1546 TaxID=3366810 RepID=UPI00372D01B4